MLSAFIPRLVLSLLLGAGAWICLLEMFYLRDQQIEVRSAIADVGQWKFIFACAAGVLAIAAVGILGSYWI